MAFVSDQGGDSTNGREAEGGARQQDMTDGQRVQQGDERQDADNQEAGG